MKCLIGLNIIMLILVITTGISLFVKDKAIDVTYAYSENLLDELYEQGARGRGGRGGKGGKGNSNGRGNKGNGRGTGRGNGKGGRGSRGTN